MKLNDAPLSVLDCHNILGESILWDDRSEMLWWTNIHAREIWSWSPWQSAAPRVFPISQRVGALALRETSGLAVALETGFGLFDSENGEVTFVAEVDNGTAKVRLNDGRVDPAGRFICGGMHEGQPQRPLASLWSWEGEQQVTRILPAIACANSICWSPDGNLLYFTDMPEGRIKTYSWDKISGRPDSPRHFADLSDQPGLADGSVVDAEGYLWNAQWGGARLVRYAPDGHIDRIVPLPVENPTCLTFGGRNLDVLFVTSAWWELSEVQKAKQPLAGNLFAFKPGVYGQRENRFQG